MQGEHVYRSEGILRSSVSRGNELPLFQHPLLYRPRFRREVHADQVKLAFVCLEGAGILVVLDLPQGFLGGLVQLQLYM